MRVQGNTTGLSKFKLKIEDAPRRKHMVFLGGAVLAGIIKDRDDCWVLRDEWKREGMKAAERKLGFSK